MKENPIRDRTYAFAVAVVRFSRTMIRRREFVLSKQLLRAGTSVGANVQEAVVGQSRRDFIAKMSIARKEAHECGYWIRLIRDAELAPSKDVQALLDESESLARILDSIVKSALEQQTHNS